MKLSLSGDFVVVLFALLVCLVQWSMHLCLLSVSEIQPVDERVSEIVERWMQTCCPDRFTLNTLYKDAKLIGQLQSECSGRGQSVDALLNRSLMKLLKEDILTVASAPDGDATFQVKQCCSEGLAPGWCVSYLEML